MRGKRQGKKANCEERAQSVIKPARKPNSSPTRRAGRAKASACHRRSREVSRDGRHGEKGTVRFFRGVGVHSCMRH